MNNHRGRKPPKKNRRSREKKKGKELAPKLTRKRDSDLNKQKIVVKERDGAKGTVAKLEQKGGGTASKERGGKTGLFT